VGNRSLLPWVRRAPEGDPGEADLDDVRDSAGRDRRHDPRDQGARHGARAAAVKEIYDRGELVDDATIIELIESRLDRGDTIPGFILDGFPRNIAQAEALDELLARLGRDLDVVFELQIPGREVLIERIAKRAARERDAPTTPRTRSGSVSRSTTGRPPRWSEHYRATRGNVVGIHADRPRRRGVLRDPGNVGQAAAR
jgi:adenylate kinase family enzyme